MASVGVQGAEAERCVRGPNNIWWLLCWANIPSMWGSNYSFLVHLGPIFLVHYFSKQSISIVAGALIEPLGIFLMIALIKIPITLLIISAVLPFNYFANRFLGVKLLVNVSTVITCFDFYLDFRKCWIESYLGNVFNNKSVWGFSEKVLCIFVGG